MLKNYSLSALLLLLAAPLFGGSNSYRLTGYMGVQGGESFTYRLELKDSTGNWLAGYAYTYVQEQNNVKSYIVARLDREQRTLQVSEKQIIHNHQFYSKAIICLVNADLTYDGQKLSGNLRTQTAGNYHAECAKGSITFLNKEELDQLFSAPEAAVPAAPAVAKTPAETPSAPPATVPQTAAPRPKVQAPATEQITEGKDKSYTWKSNEITIEIWDGNAVDNDIISILYNGEKILDNYSLKKEKKVMVLPLGGNELNIITIEANNEGGDPPNTANILLRDGTSATYDIIAHNKTGKRAVIRIKKQP